MTNDQPGSELVARIVRELMQVSGVQAVGESFADNAACLKVYFANESGMKSSTIPDELEGIPIVKVVSGVIESQ